MITQDLTTRYHQDTGNTKHWSKQSVKLDQCQDTIQPCIEGERAPRHRQLSMSETQSQEDMNLEQCVILVDATINIERCGSNELHRSPEKIPRNHVEEEAINHENGSCKERQKGERSRGRRRC